MSSEPHVGEAPAGVSVVDEIRDEILRRERFLLTSHARPDGDSIGSQLAMAFALDALGKQVRIVNSDAAPDHYQEFPGMERIEISRSAGTADVDAVIVMECSDLGRSGVQGLGTSSSSTSITMPETACTARSTGTTSRRRPAARWCST